jgi:ethanolamine phosphate transferase 2 subunit G
MAARLTFCSFALLATRLIRGWNQTGQKFAGNPDIVKGFMVPNPQVLWLITGVAYLWMLFQTVNDAHGLAPAGLLGATVLAAFIFKVEFTNGDAPELVVGFARVVHDLFPGPSLLIKVRLVFVGIVASAGCSVFRSSMSAGGTSKLAGE